MTKKSIKNNTSYTQLGDEPITFESDPLNNTGIRNQTQNKYYDPESITNGTYNLYPKYYMKYKSEIKFLNIIKSSLDLPETYEELKTIEILDNITKFTKIFNSDDTLLYNTLFTSIKTFTNAVKTIVPLEENSKLYNECYNDLKSLINPFGIGRILCLIKKNNGYISNSIKKEIIDYFFKFKENLVNNFDDTILYIFVKMIHLSRQFEEDIPFITDMNKIFSDDSSTTSSTTKVDDLSIIIEFINSQKFPKKILLYVSVLLEIFVNMILSKIQNIASLMEIIKNIIDVNAFIKLNRIYEDSNPIVLGELSLFIIDVINYNIYYSAEDQIKSDNHINNSITQQTPTTSSYMGAPSSAPAYTGQYMYGAFTDTSDYAEKPSLFEALFGNLLPDIQNYNIEDVLEQIDNSYDLEPFVVNADNIDGFLIILKIMLILSNKMY